MRSLATARMARPVSVRVIKIPSKAHITMAATNEMTLGNPINKGPTSNILSLYDIEMVCELPEKNMSARFSMTMDKPSVMSRMFSSLP